MFSLSSFSDVLRSVSEGLRWPVIILLIILLAATVVLIGTIIAEVFTERRYLKADMPHMVDDIRDESKEINQTIKEGNLLKRQKAALLELTRHSNLSSTMRESLAIRLLSEEQAIYDRRVKVTDFIAKIGPMLGLLGTLIPLGPGIIALGQGDTNTLSQSLLTAFDTTIAGLAAAAIALLISSIRKTWYSNYMSVLETLMECVLEEENREEKDA
ncbi:MAG: MotA/TolQ/ExbB proton channel family protein [Eubacteriaceae bacterium]|nr:MotA/TolQ/ExbB proton channel family protein [Eubacteriaceae bacterium]